MAAPPFEGAVVVEVVAGVAASGTVEVASEVEVFLTDSLFPLLLGECFKAGNKNKIPE